MKDKNLSMQEPGTESNICRRQFLSRMTQLLGGLVGLTLGIPSLIYLISPAWKRRQEDWVEVCSADSLPQGIPVKIDYVRREADGWNVAEGRNSVWLLREKDNLTAFNPRCTHLGCPYRWDSEKKSFLCPCHSAVFSKSGEVISGPPPRPLDKFPVKEDQRRVWIMPAKKAQT